MVQVKCGSGYDSCSVVCCAALSNDSGYKPPEKPSYKPPVYEKPSYKPPVVYEKPSYKPPVVYEKPSYKPPSYDPPAYPENPVCIQLNPLLFCGISWPPIINVPCQL
jgi:hypothetical protein